MLRSAALLLLALSTSLQAQTPPAVRPGGVATLVVTLPATPEAQAWRLRPTAGVRTFSPVEGVAPATTTDLHLPFTFGVPPRALAGRLVLAELVIQRGTDPPQVRELAVEVAATRRATLTLEQQALTAPPGRSADVAFRLTNDGNATDTFRITLAVPSSWPDLSPRLLVLAPGEARSAAFRTTVPSTATGGQEHLLRITMSGTQVRQAAAVRLTVLTPEPAFGSLATVPGALFVGSSSGETGGAPAVALTAAGQVRPGLRVSMAVRHVDDLSPAQAFRSELSGPRLRVDLEGSHWTAAAGDLFSFPDVISGPAIHARGVRAAFHDDAWSADLLVARPWSYTTEAGRGHVLRATASRTTAYGTFGFRAASVTRDETLLGASSHRGGTATYRLRTGAHDVHAELGWLEVGADSAITTGAAGQLSYHLNGARVALSARVRTVPATTARTAGYGNEASVFGSYRLTPMLALTGSAYGTDAPRVDGGPHGASRGGAVGLRLDAEGGAMVRLTGRYRASEHVGSTVPPSETRALTLGGALPVGGVVLEAEADAGATAGLLDDQFLSARLGARWHGREQWGWVGVSHHAGGPGGSQVGLELAGSARLRGAELRGGLSTRLSGADRIRGTSFWSGAEVPVTGSTDLTLGADFRGYMPGSAWRFSLGIRRSFGMPLPMARQPVLRGLLYEDLDGDGVRAAGEPPLPGIGVSLGPVRTTTDEEGRFRFYDGRPERLKVDGSALPMGMAVILDSAGLRRRAAEIAVVRTATLEAVLFLDRDRDGEQDAAEEAAVGAIVSLIDAGGAARDVVADSAGRARFSGLRPGRYRLVVQRVTGRGPAATVERHILLTPGASEALLIAVPLRTRDIRLPGGAAATEAPPPPPAPARPREVGA